MRLLRLKSGLKAYWIAAQMGIPASTLSMLESGSRYWTEEKIKQFKKIVGAE